MSKKVILTVTKDAVTGKREISIAYNSDPDALSYEHEEEHADMVKSLGLSGIAKRDASASGKSLVHTEEQQKESIAQK